MRQVRRKTGISIESLERREFLSASPFNLPAEFQPNIYVTASASVTNTTPFGYTPTQIRAAYGLNNITFSGGSIIGKGSGQTIAIVDAYDDPNIASDLASFDKQFGVAPLDGVNGDGVFSKIKMSNSTPVNSGWAMEEALDVEWAHAIAPKANITLVEASSDSGADLLAAVNAARTLGGVDVVSMSWGAGEFNSESYFDSYFTTPAGHKQVTFVAAAGDDGAGAEWPSVSPNVVSVGGSSLVLSASGSVISDTAWNYGSGGISAYESKPAYQSAVTLSATQRVVPDVSYNADPNHGFAIYNTVAYQGSTGWFEVGGTSAGAPQWAAIFAIADQGRFAQTQCSLNSGTQTLPMLYAAGTRGFTDITQSLTAGPANTASAGFDLVTGLGDPKATSVIEQILG